MMAALLSLLAGLFKTLFVRLPLGIWLAVIICGAWVALERHYQADYPLLPCTTTWPVELVNPAYPNSPSRVPQVSELAERIANLNLGVGQADLAFGQVGYGVMLGIAFGLLLAWPCGIWKTFRNYSGVLMFPVRVVLLGASYAALFGALGDWLSSTWGSHLLTSGYLGLFGFSMPILVPLPFWVLRPLFPSAARRQANLLIKQARRETSTSLANVAKHDSTLGDVTKGKSQQEWEYYGTVCGVFIASLLAEKRGVSNWRRRIVERQVRKRLNRLFEKGEHGLTAVAQFSREQLERKTKFTTEVLVGLWLAMQMKGDLNPQRDKDLASSLGAHLIQGMSSTWTKTGSMGTVLVSMLLWTGVAGLAVAALEPQELEQQLAQLGWKTEAPVEPTEVVPRDLPSVETSEQAPEADETAQDIAVSENNSGDEVTAIVQTDPALPSSNAAVVAQAKVDAASADEPTIDESTVDQTLPKSAAIVSTETQVQADEEGSTHAPEAVPEVPSRKVTPESRSWSHVSGRTIEGVALSYWSGAVELERTDGRKAFIEIAQLSQEDRQVVYQQFATALAASNPLPGSLITRNWTPASGDRQVLAALVSATAENVELLRDDGKLFTIPLARLSKSDQAFTKEQFDAAPRQR